VAAVVAEFVDVVKTYRSGPPWRRQVVEAVRGISFRIQAGEVFGLLGPNRAGKTTLVKLLLSLSRPTDGEVLRLGQPVGERNTLARVGYMHENQAFPRYLTASGLLEYYGALTLMPQPTVRKRMTELLDRVGLADRSHEAISRFSKGMTQRLALAQSLLNEPDLLVLDEPTEGLDLQGRQLLRRVMSQFREQGKTVVLVSHVLTEVEQLCDRVAVLNAGRLAHLGPLAELTRDPDSSEARPLEQALQDIYRKKST